jgi:hypothetical protein
VVVVLHHVRGRDHPLNQLGRERWLRHRIVHCPSLIDVRRLEPMAPPAPRPDLRVPLLAPAKGTDSDGADVVVACSVGFDPTFVPLAADLHAARAQPGTRLILVAPEPDSHPLIKRAAADVRAGASLRRVPHD